MGRPSHARNEQITVLFYGVHKDGATLGEILNKETFAGTLISDDAAVYKGFTKSQKCWAHLLRKAIKLTIEDPQEPVFRKFADRLLEIFNQAKQIKADRRLLDSTRLAPVAKLDDELLELCVGQWVSEETGGDEPADDFRRLCQEIMRLMLDKQLFVFVTEADVDGTNNAAERQLRDDASARKVGRSSKTRAGAKRRSVIRSVLQSIGKQLGTFTLQSVIAEASGWIKEGLSCFAKQVEQRGLSPPESKLRTLQATDRPLSLLDRVILLTDANPSTCCS